MVQIIWIVLILFCTTVKVSFQIKCGQTNETFWPWHVTIEQLIPDPDVPACGGTILNELFVITAGHCVYDLSGSKILPSQLVVTIDRPKSVTKIPVKRVIFPYDFDVNRFQNDVVLVKLEQKIELSNEVNPICFSEEGEVFPTGSVTVPLLMANSKSVHNLELKITNYTLCHGTNHYIFNASYDHSICMGYLRDTDKFQLHRGSSLMVQRNNTWHLIGILLYTIGPSEGVPTYGGGLILAAYAKAIIKTANKHLTPGISDLKCREYNQIVKEKPQSYFDPYISLQRKNDDFVMPGCIGTLISEKFILTSAICTHSLERIVLWKNLMETKFYNKFRIHFHPNDVMQRSIALVELDEKASQMEYYIHCLWTNDEDALAFETQFAHGSQLLHLSAKVQYQPMEAVSYRFENCFHFSVSLSCKPGDVLSTKKSGENVRRIVGLITENVMDCRTKTALNVVRYVDWIEGVVWKNETSMHGI